MYLKHLKITGFKSFGREVTFTFDKNLNIIVGPNGSGKSNIIDAVKWLLGEAKYKSIRLEHPDSVLFNGNDSLSAAKSAKVEMIIDNSDSQIPEFDKEIVISRTYRKGDSRYYMNDKRVNLKEIKSFIADKGLGKEFYSIISQGKITELVKSGGKSMKSLLDQASGISPFYQKKAEALKNLEQTEQNMIRISDIMKEINSRKNSLYLQAKRAEKYIEYRKKLNNLKATKISREIDVLDLKLKSSDEVITNINNSIKDTNELLTKKNSKLTEYRNKYSKIDQLMKELTSVIDSLRSKEDKFNDKLNNINSQLSKKNSLRDNLKYEIESSKGKLQKTLLQIDDMESYLKNLLLQLKNKEEEYTSYEEKRKTLTRKVDEIQKTNFSIQEEIFKLKSQLSEMKSNLESRDQKLKNIDSEIESLTNDIKNNEYKITQSKDKMEIYRAKMEKYEKMDEDLKNQIKEKEILLHNLKHHFEDVNSQLNKLNLTLSSLKESFKMNQKWMDSYEGYSRSVKTIFREAKKNPAINLVDTVANILKPIEGYELAINALISSRLQNVITKTSNDAKLCISILQKYKAGRVTFLPLDLIKSSVYSYSKPINVIDFARNLVEYDKQFESIVNFLFTNSVVVESIDKAISLKKSNYKGRIATLKGEVIQPGGAIVGGSTDEHSLSLMNRQKILDELNERIAAVEKDMDLKTIELSKISIKMNEAMDKIKDLKSKGSVYQTEYDKLKNQIELYSEMISAYEENILKLDRRLKSLEKLKPNLKGEMEDLKSKVDYMVSLINEKEEIRENIKVEMDDILDKYKKINTLTSEKLQEYQKIKNEYDAKNGSIISLKAEVDELENNIVKAEIDLKSLVKDIDTLNDDLFYIKSDIGKVREEITSKIDEMKSNSELKSKGAELLQSLRDEVRDLEDKLSSLKDDLSKEELNKKEYQVKIQDLKLRLEEIEYEEIYTDNFENIDELIRETEDKIKHIGTVNLNAFSEYQEVVKRYEEYENQKKDILLAKEKLEYLIAKLDEEAKNRFLNSLKDIQLHFNKMMDILFNGGSGDIILTNPENVLETEVDISVKIPHKKIKSLYAMSGGEQTLIGIALMFAFLKINPSPFYILDEIDANLDSANTERISNLLKNLSEETQFIVITHNKIMMDIAKTIYGITMEKGLTKAIKVSLV